MTIVDIVRYGGDSGIVTNRRQAAYQKAIFVVKNAKATTKSGLYKELVGELTKKPCTVMKDLYQDNETTLEDKHPYNGVTIRHGKVVGESEFAKEYNAKLEAFGNLSQLTGIGIGIGDSAVAELVKMGYTQIEQLKEIYTENQFEDFRKGLKGPLCKFFEDHVHDKRLTREQVDKWKEVIDPIVEKYEPDRFSIAGSYARKKKTIGDIDYVILIDDEEKLFDTLNSILDDLSEITEVDGQEVILGAVDETPSKPGKKKRYSTGMKLWFDWGEQKVKLEIYGYAIPEDQWCFAYFARSGSVSLQKRIKFHASKKNYKLGPFALDKKGTDTPIWEYPDGLELIKKRLGKEQITTIRDIFDFLEFKK